MGTRPRGLTVARMNAAPPIFRRVLLDGSRVAGKLMP
jgi:hypothetical protein